jgi:putative toxin-antitoxin system antitoxin component (TIGR02293 family)
MVKASRIAETLGGYRVMRRRVRSADGLRARVRTGLPYSALEALAERLGAPVAEMADLIGLPARTMARRRGAGRFTAGESDRLVRLGRIAALAEQVLGDRDKAVRWLHRENRALGQRVPLRQLDTDLGASEVEAILLRIEHGVYS